MFKHILLPIDGSELTGNLVRATIAFAREAGAKVIGMHVIPEFHVFTHEPAMLESTREEFIATARRQAKKYLAEIETAAKVADVACDTFFVTSDDPYEEIIKACKEWKCDLIVMASHGRTGLKSVLLGSQTQKVLIYSEVPVLVYR